MWHDVVKTSKKERYLLSASANGNIKKVKKLLAKGVDVNGQIQEIEK